MIAILNSNNVVVQLYNNDPTDPTQSLGAYSEFAAGLTPPCTAVECDGSLAVGDTFESAEP